MILCFLAAQNVGQLQAIRGFSRFLNKSIKVNEYTLVRDALTSRDSRYYIVHSLYRGLYKPINPGFRYLFSMARHYEIAKGLSSALADKLVHKHPSLPLKRLKRSSYDRFIRNVEPYVLALAHFLECYRDELANYAVSANQTTFIPIPCVVVERLILSSRYDEETVYRICTLYDMLKGILDRDLNSHGISHRSSNMFELHDVIRRNYTDSLNIFVFGGLEAVKDLLAEPDPASYHSIIDAHFKRAYPDTMPPTRPHNLPPSILRRLDWEASRKICQLLPDHPHRILNLHRLRFAGHPAPRCWRERGIDRFYQHLVKYEGEEPGLVLEG